jgi:(S)-ureidoglycine aminohydrolase
MRHFFFILLQTIVMNAFSQLPVIPSGVVHWNELPVKKEAQRESRKIAEGSTAEFSYFEIHATTQEKGALPKPAHTQQDIEEMMIIKEGTMKCTIGNRSGVLSTGSVIMIPPLESQSFENIGDGPLTYYVFMFRSKKQMDTVRSNKAGGALLLNIDSLPFKTSAKGGGRKYFDRPTAMCENFEMHVTQLLHKGPSHDPHRHIDTEMLLVTEGQVEMMIDGTLYTGGPGDLFFAASGTLHGVGNATDKPCSYFAFKWR